MGDKIHHVQAMDILAVEEIDCLAFLFVKDGHQHVGAGHLFLAGGLHAEDGALEHTLEPQGWLGITIRITFRQQRGGVLNKLA